MIVLDAAGPILFVAFGLVAVAAAYVVIVVVETMVLAAMRWASFGRTLADVLLMNVISWAIGFGILMWIGFGGVLGGDDQPLLLVTLAVAFVASVVSEALFRMLMRRQPRPRTWSAALFANLASYAALAIAVFVLGRVGV